MTALDHDQWLAVESARFLDAIDRTEGSEPVPTCPEWTADDLLWHLAGVQHFWARIVVGRLEAPPAEQPDRPDGRGALRSFFDDAHARLVGALASAGDDEVAWTWFAADRTVGFTRRRQALEALVHRIDAELITDSVSAVDPDLAADGLDELLTVMFGGLPPWGTLGGGGPVGRIEATDIGVGWTVQVARFSGTSPESGRTYEDEPILVVADAGSPTTDFEIRASSVDLLRWGWNRRPVGAIRRSGDTSAIDAMVADGLD